MIETLDATARLIAVGASLMLLTLLLAGKLRPAIRFAMAGLLVSGTAYLVNSTGVLEPPSGIRRFVDLASIFTPFWTWLFGRRLFEDEPSAPVIGGAAAGLLLGWLIAYYTPALDPLGFYAIHVVALALIADLLRVAWVMRADDLIEKRRTVRLWLPLLVGLQTGGVLVFETLLGRSIPYPPVQLANALLILALILFAGLALLRIDNELLPAVAPATTGPRDPAELSASETVLSHRLAEAIADGIHRTPGLTITGLAAYLETPEHRLRALINRRLGYRNFSAYLNHHRIADAREMLSNPKLVDLPVLTIAMDLGYNSLPTFNRAFRQEAGMTPTDFRRDALIGGVIQN